MTTRLATIAGAVTLLLTLLLIEGMSLSTAWLPEEAAIAEQARGGPSFVGTSTGAYPLVLRPAGNLLEGGSLLGFGRLLSALAWLGLAVPAYALARRYVTAPVAAAAGALTVLVPAAVYATALLPDAPATLLAAASLALFVRAQEDGSRRALVLSLAVGICAAFLRPWFVVLPLALGVAAVWPRLGWRRLAKWPRPLALVLLAGFAYTGLQGVSPELEQALMQPEEILRAGAASFAAAAVGTGILPWLVAWARVGSTSAGSTLVLAGVVLSLAAGVTAVAGGVPMVDERPLLAVYPLVFALAAQVWTLGLPSARAMLVSTVALAAAALALPSSNPEPVLHDAPGLELASAALGSATRFLWVLVVALGLLLLVVRRSRATWTALAIALVLAGHGLAWRAAERAASTAAAELPQPRDWLDRHVDEEAAVGLLIAPGDPAEDHWQLAVWNRSLGPLLAVDTTSPDAQTGAIRTAVPTPFVLARAAPELVGDTLARHGEWTLTRVDAPLRAAAATEGVYGDGWSGERAVYRRFAGPARPGSLELVLSRRAWSGPDVPGNVVVSVGPFGDARPIRGVEVHSGQEHRLSIPVPPPPFEVVIEVEPTFSPADFGQEDARRLGVQLSFAYLPASP